MRVSTEITFGRSQSKIFKYILSRLLIPSGITKITIDYPGQMFCLEKTFEWKLTVWYSSRICDTLFSSKELDEVMDYMTKFLN